MAKKLTERITCFAIDDWASPIKIVQDHEFV